MYITITAQKLGGNYSQSSADFAEYLEKENQGLGQEDVEHFFNQYDNFNCFWRPELIFLSSATRVTSYIESRLITIGVKTKPYNYPFFLAKRYGKVLTINHKNLHKLDDLKHKYEFPENDQNRNNFKLENNIPRLESFYKKIININDIYIKNDK